MTKVLVTGAAGFLGGWIVECFQLSGIPVCAGIRRWNRAVRLARRPTDIVLCDVLRPDQLQLALEGCDAVVHCAVGDDEVTVNGTRNVMQAAQAHSLRRVIYISSVAVYGKVPGYVEETHPLQHRGNAYARRKIEAEQVCREFSERGVPVVILRPTLIYGPFGETWTVSFARRLASGTWGTFGRAGEGTCNLVYVTDVVQAVHRALLTDQCVGEAYNVNGDELISWNDYFVRYNAALGLGSLRSLRAWPLAWRARLLSPVRTLGHFALSHLRDTVFKIRAKSTFAAKYLRATESSLRLTPTPEQLKLYGLKAEYRINKAQSQLGYHPQVDVTRGLRFCAAWSRHQGIVPTA